MSESNNKTTDYISLGSVKKTIAEFLRYGYRFMNFIALAVRRNVWLFLFCMAMGLGLAYLFSRLIPRYFETEMIIQQNDLPRRAYAEIIYNLNSLINSKSFNDLASELRLTRKEVSKINSLEAFSLMNEPLAKDTSTRLGLPIKIRVRLEENNLIPKLQAALISYFNNISYVKQMRESQKMVFLQKLDFIEQEQRKLDSLKDTYNRSLATMRLPTTFYNNGLNPAEIYKHSLDLASQKQILLRWLNTEAKGVLLIDGLKQPERPQSISTVKILVIGLFSGMALGFILAMLSALKIWAEKK